MPAWGEILQEIGALQIQGNSQPFDFVRRKYLTQLYQRRGRAVILYASKWTQAGNNLPPDLTSISDEDLQALMTVMNGVHETALDLILHSPGGSIDAAEALVTYLRSKFSDICVIVPQQAMSAATMIACAADSIMLGKHSFLGPTDPQLILQTELGMRVVTAQNIVDQFERAQKECADPSKIGAWIPILKQFGPDMLQKCKNASEHSRALVAGWLEQYMFKGEPDARKKAKRIASWISSHKYFKSHGRHLSRDFLRSKGLDKIIDLEADEITQDLVLSVFHSTTATFDSTAAVKLVENHLGKIFVKQVVPSFSPMMTMPPQMMQPTRRPIPANLPIAPP